MEFQLRRLLSEKPMLLSLIEKAIINGYEHAESIAINIGNIPMCRSRMGYMRLPLIEATIQRTIEEANIDGVTVRMAYNNNRSAVHLEIETSYCILMFASVRHNGDVPGKAKYRQKYIDQCFMAEVYPEYEPFTEFCKPLYIITHAPSRVSAACPELTIGRLSVDQSYWSCRYSFSQLQLESRTIENVTPNENTTIHENIAKMATLRLKQS